MSRTWFFLSSIMIFLAAMAVVLGILTVSPAQAQCGDTPADSSCITCHETQGMDFVSGKGEWHAIHVRKDCCWSCHGGNTQAQSKDLAHVGMTANPLEDIYTDCYSCHPDDYPARRRAFAVVLGVTPSSGPTSTPVPAGHVVEHPIVILPPSVPNAPSSFPFSYWHWVGWPSLFSFPLVLGLSICIYAQHKERSCSSLKSIEKLNSWR